MRSFYLFSSVHSLLIGLLPFFIPVIFWQHGYGLKEIILVIALSGGGFVLALPLWDWLQSKGQGYVILALSFLFEVALVYNLIYIKSSDFFVVIVGLLNGFYNCFFWMTQRYLFAFGKPKDRNHYLGLNGRRFGNFQVLVVFFLKVGVLASAFLLEWSQSFFLLLLSILLSFFGFFIVVFFGFSKEIFCSKRVGLEEVFLFNDNRRSKWVFLFDGIFLYLESYFWLLSMYRLGQNNIMMLGILVVTLALLVSFIFFVLKNYIDSMDMTKLFPLAVGFYLLSWLLRGCLEQYSPILSWYPAILLIAFLTTFFRLVFNKVFFDIAATDKKYVYLLSKSYYSQFGLLIFFMLIYMINADFTATSEFFSSLYFMAGLGSLMYLFYRYHHLQEPSIRV